MLPYTYVYGQDSRMFEGTQWMFIKFGTLFRIDFLVNFDIGSKLKSD